MKTIFSLLGLAVILLSTLAGCAHRTPPPPRSTVLDSNDPTKRTYSRDDLYGTGRRDTGAALESIDPSIQSTGGR